MSMPTSQLRGARHVLVFEPDDRGHAEEWLLHIVRFAREEHPNVRVTLAVPRSLARRIAPEHRAASVIAIISLDEAEVRRCLSSNLAFAAFARWWSMRRHAALVGADEGLFMCIDSLSLPLALGLGLGGRQVSGILFRPSVHYAGLGPAAPTLGERVRDWRKRVLYPLMLKNPLVRVVHSLDPYFPAFAREKYSAGDKVVGLDDPFVHDSELPEVPPRVRGFPKDRVAFLLFGELTERKGVLQFLQACQCLAPEIAKRMAVLVAGRIDRAIEDRVQELVRAVRTARPDLWLAVDDRRLSFTELAGAVHGCDVVVAPYQRFVGSSGVLIWAARALRPVLTQHYGVLDRLVRDFGLGMTVDTTSPNALAGAMEHAVRVGPKTLVDPAGACEFLAHRDGRGFAAQLLNVADAEHRYASFTSARAHRAKA